MKDIKGYEQLQKTINEEKILLIFASLNGCSVCSVDYPLVKELADKYSIALYNINIESEAEIRGQLRLFTAPVVMLFYNGRLYHRQARIIDFEELKNRMEELVSI
ncbi:MAG: thioredoxin family protein [Peptoniphilus sp.]|nr:thioredoxin family protein [Peptoniphilus sp.]